MTATTAIRSNPTVGDAVARREPVARGGGLVRFWLRAEGAAAFVAGAALYLQAGGEAWLLIPLLLVPDLGMLGYLGGARLGAITYNLVHNWVVGLTLLGGGAWLGSDALWLAGAVLIAHVGMDRAMGYGLKLATGFKRTHLQAI
ncbi:MAG TPA: DUF4260 domain-containing protein [Thermoanaerobaculia bacterium]|nr:DUF4260 domain-containing protein [Thermoanaerobaculia bacterium]